MSETTIETSEAVRLVEALGAACAAVDGVPPFNDQALVELRRGERRAIGDANALAVIGGERRAGSAGGGNPSEPPEVELAVHPEHRGRALSIGERLEVLKDYPTPPGCTSPFAPIWITEIVRRQSLA